MQDIIKENHSLPQLSVPSSESTEHAVDPSTHTSPVRGRKRRRHSALSQSPMRSPSPSRGHERSSASRYREMRRSRLSQLAVSEGSDTSDGISNDLRTGKKTPKRLRRRSDIDPDHTFRGRPRHRSPGKEDVIVESSSEDPTDGDTSGSQKENYTTRSSGKKRRSSPPSRASRATSEHGSNSPVLRRRRSLPNQYRGLKQSRETTNINSWTTATG